MNRLKTIFDSVPIHPFLFALYPVLFLWVDNIDQIPFFAILSSLFLSEGLAIFVYATIGLVCRNSKNSAVISSIFILITLSYGHIYNFIEDRPAINAIIGYYRLLAILLLVPLVGIILIWRIKGIVPTINKTMQVISVLLIAINIGLATLFYIQGISAKTSSLRKQPNISNRTHIDDFTDRDVYYIVLDSYGREDVLESHFRYDNHSFIQELLNLGFVIPECTQSNYDSTLYSLSSSLNMNYISELPVQKWRGSKEIFEQALSQLIKHSFVREKFEELGFTTVTFKALYPFLDTTDSDYYFDFEQSAGFSSKLETENFQYLFYNTTILRIPIEILEASPDYLFEEKASPTQVYFAKILTPQKKLFSTRHFKQYEQNLYAFERLEEIPEIPGNKFVYAHLFSTHQPFVFTADGRVRWPVIENNAAYRDQITYTNSRMIKIINTILKKSVNPPVIILQGDHSYVNGRDRNKILNAYYLPDGGPEKITRDFTPVNTFRLVFNTYFGANYEILPNNAIQEGKTLSMSCVE